MKKFILFSVLLLGLSLFAHHRKAPGCIVVAVPDTNGANFVNFTSMVWIDKYGVSSTWTANNSALNPLDCTSPLGYLVVTYAQNDAVCNSGFSAGTIYFYTNGTLADSYTLTKFNGSYQVTYAIDYNCETKTWSHNVSMTAPCGQQK